MSEMPSTEPEETGPELPEGQRVQYINYKGELEPDEYRIIFTDTKEGKVMGYMLSNGTKSFNTSPDKVRFI